MIVLASSLFQPANAEDGYIYGLVLPVVWTSVSLGIDTTIASIMIWSVRDQSSHQPLSPRVFTSIVS